MTVAAANLVEHVYSRLLAQLAGSEDALGSHLKADQVAESFAVSPATARKAIARLAREGWLAVGDNGRPTVARRPPASAVPASIGVAGPIDAAYRTILAKALDRGFRPGEIIKARPLAAQMGISLATVRAALDRLARDGVLDRAPRQGWRVAELSLDEIVSMFEVRRRLEPMVLARAFSRIDDKLVDDLLRETEQVIRDFRDIERSERVRAEARFHQSLVEMAGDSVLAAVLHPLIRKMMMTVSVSRGLSRSSFPEHRRVLEAIQRRDLKLAVECLERDLRNPTEVGFIDWD
jgi:DNA-binding GntR family transcriptional regulator